MEPPRQKIQGGSSSPPNLHRPLSRSGPEAHQLGRGRAGEQHTRSTSLDGGDPSDRREEARASPHQGQKGPGEDPGNPSRQHLEAAQLPFRAAGSGGRRIQLRCRRLRPRCRPSVPGDSPKDRAPRSQIFHECPSTGEAFLRGNGQQRSRQGAGLLQFGGP
ncbi:hypothetical protein NDU88_004975 [Pleurodeles waltl]|uniref:Uncharacterized protein n=1 Tax=Pleurodeles waltl TaxID=8319 RepID=A0AAV7W9D8_PLEWA|nr:hypothetical protein NDU88_004975 [Pleurodeles waltl]